MLEPAHLCLVNLLSWEQCSQLEQFRMERSNGKQHIQFKTNFIGNNDEARAELTAIPFDV